MQKYTPNSKLLDKLWLQDQYEVQQKSLRTIAIELGVTTAVVSKYVKRYGFNMRSAGESKSLTSKNNGPIFSSNKANQILLSKEKLYQLYVIEGWSTRMIANSVGLKNRSAINKALIFNNIPIRTLKEARVNRTSHGRTKKKPNPILTANADYILNAYKAGESIRSIRHRLNLSRDAIYRLLDENGLTIRSSSEARIGSKHSPETLAKMSKTASNQILDGTRSSHSNGKRMNVLTPNNGFLTMRSSWEKKYADFLTKNNIDYYYETKNFPLSNGKSYVADFYLPATDEYVEIKGYLSQDQSDKYELFKQEYPNLKWKILYKENLIDLGIDLKKDIKTVYLLIGAPAAGKSWVAKQLIDQFTYISYDENSKKEHLTLLLSAPVDKPIIYDPTFKISTLIRCSSNEFNIRLIAIQEEETTLKARVMQRGGSWTGTIMKRNVEIKKRYEKYGADGFCGTSSECLEYLRSLI